MNLDIIKEKISSSRGRKVKITVYGLRNKISFYEGTIHKIYPNIFTIVNNQEEKSFAYRDIVTKDIKIMYI